MSREPPVRQATIRGGYTLTCEVRQMAETVREDLEDLIAEAVMEAETSVERLQLEPTA